MKALIIILLLISVSAQAETWKITSLDWEPYSGSKLANQGNSVQKLKLLLKEHGIDLVVEFYPWLRAQEKAGTPEFVGYFPAWPEEVKEGFVASKAVDVSTIAILKNSKVQGTFSSIEDMFKNYKVGYVKTYVYPDEIQKAIDKYSQGSEAAGNEASLVQKLGGGRNDFAITDPNVMLYMADQKGVSNIEIVKEVMEKDLVVAFRAGSDNKKRVEFLNSLLK